MSPSSVRTSTRRKPFLPSVSPNSRSPAPRTTGKTFSRSSSTRPCSHQRAHDPGAGRNDDLPGAFRFQLRDLAQQLAPDDRRVVPVRIDEGRGHDVLGHAVQPVCQLAAPRRPSGGEPLVGPPAHQHGLGAQRLVEREPGELRAVLDQADPTTAREAFVAGRVLEDSVERDVVTDDDRSHSDVPLSGSLHPFPATYALSDTMCGIVRSLNQQPSCRLFVDERRASRCSGSR